MTNKKIILRLPGVLESVDFGVMEYWSNEKEDIKPLVIAPTLQYSNASELIEIRSPQYGLPYFGLKIQKITKIL